MIPAVLRELLRMKEQNEAVRTSGEEAGAKIMKAMPGQKSSLCTDAVSEGEADDSGSVESSTS
jgi:hypothetical protein